MPITVQRLRTATEEFFRLHWNLPEAPPTWFERPFTGVGFPSTTGHLPGCYALARETGVVYIGSAISRGKTRYVGYGLHSRLLSYVRRDRSVRRPDGQHVWSFTRGHSSIYTIGFPLKRGYLALALEHFLVGRFQDQLENKNRVFRAPLARATGKA
jgi:hypothetical protein